MSARRGRHSNLDEKNTEPFVEKIDDESGMLTFGTTTLRYHWFIRRLTIGRFTLEARTDVYISAIKFASLGWLVDFASSAHDDYNEQENGSQREEDCLISEDAVAPLVDLALEAIHAAAADGSLLHHRDLFYILYRWRDFRDNDPTEARAWTDSLLNDEDALVIFARQLTGEVWSQGMGFGELGDRVAQRRVRVRIDENIDILDADRFRVKLECLHMSDRLDESSQKTIDEFLEAWDRVREGRDR